MSLTWVKNLFTRPQQYSEKVSSAPDVYDRTSVDLESLASTDASTLLDEERTEKRHTGIDARVVSDAIIGLSDGLTVPFALTAGLSALGDTRVVIYGGTAELIAGAISMGLGGYLGAKSEEESYHATLADTQQQVANNSSQSVGSLSEIFAPFELPQHLSNDLTFHLSKSPHLVLSLSSVVNYHSDPPNQDHDYSPIMSKPKVLLLGEIVLAHDAWEKFAKDVEVVTPTAKNRAEFIEECKSGKLDGVVAAYRTFPSVSITGIFDKELIEVLPKSWKFLAHNGAGYDQVDAHACAERSPPLLLSNVPGVPDDSTADTAVFLILGALRNLNTSMLALREGKWRGNPPPPLGHDPQGKVLGILGMGGIGRNLKKKMEAFDMTTIYHNRKKLPEDQAGGAKYVSFDELLAQSDVLSLNLPLNPHTRHIISTKEFEKMKKGVVIVNTARGAVMDEAALVKALDSGHVASVGLDVFEEEPKVHAGLISNPNVLLVPHMGTWCVETQTRMEEWTIGNVRGAIEKGKLVSPVPEHVDL
ncbi:hypothetical protein MBLNU459_g7025t1 [Dothideomycetes sp. NU459]